VEDRRSADVQLPWWNPDGFCSRLAFAYHFCLEALFQQRESRETPA
jgi:hypothetical protein